MNGVMGLRLSLCFANRKPSKLSIPRLFSAFCSPAPPRQQFTTGCDQPPTARRNEAFWSGHRGSTSFTAVMKSRDGEG